MRNYKFLFRFLLILLIVPCMFISCNSSDTDAPPLTQDERADQTEKIENTDDRLTFSSTSNEKAVLIDGIRNGVPENDWNPGIVSAVTDSITIGPFTETPPQSPGEVIAFSPGKVPFIKTQIPWTSSAETIQVHFIDAYDINVAVWILTESTFHNKDVIENTDCALAQSIWKQEGHGLRINCVIHDARNEHITLQSDDGVLSGLAKDLFHIETGRAFDCVNSDHASDLQNSTAHQAGVLNIYYVDQVATIVGTSPRYGIHCNQTDPPNVIAIGTAVTGTSAGILVHEIGHALLGNGLEDHIDDLSPSLFDRTNVMHGASSRRATLTEGQVFRAFFNTSSALNLASIYNLQNGLRTCGGVGLGTHTPPAHTSECPKLDKRLWPDQGGEHGTWPAN